ncbi:hypothetical protein N0V93_000999 [Gnomoniopsis smithogilvyi]|uniref:cellulase n=1 Tax=Gnomoniopsis smithogilvyi TaxID=1191159 RepID=A0A9W8Z534_9PEZI|nr:hypothetical protein N0V93_000999 [Gnomoniopsis smithogilvyi]
MGAIAYFALLAYFTESSFAGTQLAQEYGDEDDILFGLMNEPHDLDMDRWGITMQKVVDAIRKETGNNDKILLLPGTNFTSAQTFPDESAPALLKVKNPDGSTDNLVFDVHKYLDEDNSGTHTECVKDNIDDTFQPLVDFLEKEDRVAMLTETGGGNVDSCSQFLCAQMDFIDDNSDRIIGVTTFAAGGFDATFNLTETPTLDGKTFVDTSLVKDCIANRKTAKKAKKVNKRKALD